MKKYFSQLLIITLFLAGSFFSLAHAQVEEFSLYSADDIFVETYPEIPGPNQTVDLNLKSYSFNLNNYYIAWYINGEKKSADYGNRKLTFKTGGPGVATNVTAVIEYNNQVFRKELRFVPAEVDMLWEAVDAYVPPFYRGKAMPLQQAQIKITAIPETQLIAPSDSEKLVYYWDQNYKRIVPKSGFGKSSFSFELDPLLETEKITVTTNDRRENSFAKNTISIPTNGYKGKILFYEIDENDRLLTNKALNTNTVIDGDTIKFAFYPLNMSTTAPNFVDLFVDWSINDESRAPQDFAKQNQLHISSGGESGATTIGLKLSGIKKLLQETESTLALIFKGANTLTE